MTNINNTFQILSSEKEENALAHPAATGKETYISPKLVRIGSATHETAFGPRSASDGTFSS